MRFIPTHVGNTFHCSAHVREITVHPHACGEHCLFLWVQYSISGSSPRMWGTLTYASKHQNIVRFIPTHVGNTIS